MAHSLVNVTLENSDDSKSELESSEAEDSHGETIENNKTILSNEGWADSISKILTSNKPKNKKTLVLSRAKKHSEIIQKPKEEKPEFEVIGECKDTDCGTVSKDEKIKLECNEPHEKKKKADRPSIRIKPNILEKDRERLLSKIATKGVVQLFNAVRNQQKNFDKEMDADMTEVKKEKILKKFDKRTFLDSLMGQTKSIVVDEEINRKQEKDKPKEETPRWSALRDDFMTHAKMKDWDREMIEE